MSEENVEIVRRQFEEWSEGDLDAWAQCWAQTVVVTPPEGWPEGQVNHGLAMWRRQAERLRDSWDRAHVEIDEIRPVGEDRVVSRFRYVTRGKEPGISFDTSMAAAFFLRQGKIARAEYFWTFAEARAVAGLEE